MIFKNFTKDYNISMVLALSLLPLSCLIGIPLYIYFNGVVWQEPILLIINSFLAGTGITIGYHRLFAHRTFKTYPIIEWVYMICGSMALQNTILNWCSDHRRHHKLLDTDKDLTIGLLLSIVIMFPLIKLKFIIVLKFRIICLYKRVVNLIYSFG